MSYLQVKDLKKSRELWQRLEEERELVITKDGQPRAILIGIQPDELEAALSEIRRALFSAAVRRVRDRSAVQPVKNGVIEEVIRASRKRET